MVSILGALWQLVLMLLKPKSPAQCVCWIFEENVNAWQQFHLVCFQ
jgi:hypothetical protein